MNQREIKSNIFNMFDKFKQNLGNVTTLEKKINDFIFDIGKSFVASEAISTLIKNRKHNLDSLNIDIITSVIKNSILNSANDCLYPDSRIQSPAVRIKIKNDYIDIAKALQNSQLIKDSKNNYTLPTNVLSNDNIYIKSTNEFGNYVIDIWKILHVSLALVMDAVENSANRHGIPINLEYNRDLREAIGLYDPLDENYSNRSKTHFFPSNLVATNGLKLDFFLDRFSQAINYADNSNDLSTVMYQSMYLTLSTESSEFKKTLESYVEQIEMNNPELINELEASIVNDLKAQGFDINNLK